MIASQVLGFGTIYSQKHHDDLIQNNFKFERHVWEKLSETRQQEVQLNLTKIGIKVEDFKYEHVELNLRGNAIRSLVLEGTQEEKFAQIKTMIESRLVPVETRRPFP